MRLTLLTENNVPVSKLGENPEKIIKGAWEIVLAMLINLSDPGKGEKVSVEKVEVLDE